MSELTQLSNQLSNAIKKIVEQITAIDEKIAEKFNEKNRILDSPVSKAQFKAYLLKKYEEESKIHIEEIKRSINSSDTVFSKLEDRLPSIFRHIRASGVTVAESNFFLFSGEVMADKIISLYPANYFDENSLTKEERLQKVARIDAEIEALKAQKSELVNELDKAGVNY